MLKIFIFLLILSVATQAAVLGNSSPPVIITGCAVAQWHSYVYNFQGLKVRFINRGSAVADRITLRVTYAGTTKTFDDVGSFAPGLEIDHAYNTLRGLHYVNLSPRCEVEAVHFVNGESWRAGEHQAAYGYCSGRRVRPLGVGKEGRRGA